jgi:hypothetical protein
LALDAHVAMALFTTATDVGASTLIDNDWELLLQ